MINISDLIKFEEFLHQFEQIERVIYIKVNGKFRKENDSEHSYRLAMLAWYICSINKLHLDLELVIQYSLVHDLVEIYAGDTYIYTKDKKLKESKEQRESDALKRISEELWEFPELIKRMNEYQEKSSKEAKFVYALDKVEPIITNYLYSGYTWKKEKSTLNQLIEHKKGKLEASPEVKEYFDQLLEILKTHEEELFLNKSSKD